jgi:hypothetical protein
MAKLERKTEPRYVLDLSRYEAELLESYLANCLKFGADLDPQYEDHDWMVTKRTLKAICDLLPGAV